VTSRVSNASLYKVLWLGVILDWHWIR